jgi:hypothetical protein
MLSLATVFVLIAAITAGSWHMTRNWITVENRSGASVKQLTVMVGRTPIAFGTIPAGDTVQAPFEITNDCDFVLSGTLADGSLLSARDGYVTPGMYGENVRIRIEPGGRIRFTQ